MKIIVIASRHNGNIGGIIVAQLSCLPELSVGIVSQPITSGLLCIDDEMAVKMLKRIPLPIQEKMLSLCLEKESFPSIREISKIPTAGKNIFKNMKRRFQGKRRS